MSSGGWGTQRNGRTPGLIAHQRLADDEAGVGGPGVDAPAPLLPHLGDVLAVHHRKACPKRLSISPFHCSTTEGGATTTTPDAPSGAAAARGRSSSSRAQQQLAHDQPGLDRLAQAHVVGDEQAHPGHPQRLKRCWIDHPDREEEITRLEDELLAAMESFLERIDAIDLQLREAQEEQEAQVELERAVIAAAGAEAVRPSTAP